MAKQPKDKKDELVVTKEHLKASYQKFLERTSPRKFAHIVHKNFDDLEKAFKLPKGIDDLDQAIDILREGKNNALRKSLIAQIVEGNPRNFLSAREEKRIKNDALGDLILLRSVKTAGESLGALAKFNLGTAAFKGVIAAADALHAGRLKANIGAPIAATAAAAAWTVPITMAYAAISPNVDALSHSGEQSQSTMARVVKSDICSSDFMRSASHIDQAYVATFSNVEKAGTKYAVNSILAAEGHGVPLIALHNLSYVESNGHTDMLSGNSSASSLFQILDGQKPRYLKLHGQQTFAYIEAKERLRQNEGSARQLSDDRNLVQAIDYVVETPQTQIDAQMKSRNHSGPLHHALQLMNDGAMQAEIVALDMKKQIPEITQSGLSTEKIMALTVEYYRGDHFLGSYNNRLLENLAEKAPNLSFRESSKIIGNSGQATLVDVAKKNPFFLNPGMTAPQAIQSIKTNFMNKVEGPLHAYTATLDGGQAKIDECLKDEFIALPRPRPEITKAIASGEKIETPAVMVKATVFPTPRPDWLNKRPT